MNMFDVFFSYSRDISSKELDEFIKFSNYYNICIWRDIDNIIAGSSISSTFDKILAKTTKSIGAIVLIDNSYLHKSWCKKELTYLLDHNANIFIFSYQISSSEIIKLEGRLKPYNIVQLTNFDLESFNLMITHILRKVLSLSTFNLLLKNKYQKIDLCLTELYKDYINTNNPTCKIIKIHSVYYWIVYKKYCPKIKNDLDRIFDFKLLIKNNNIPPTINLVIGYLNIRYNMVLNMNTSISLFESKCLDLCLNQLMTWYIEE